MSATVTPTQSDVLTVLRSFLLLVLPPAVEVIRAQVNRVPSPKGADYVVMTPIRRSRLSTNQDAYIDVVMTGSADRGVLTITDVASGTLQLGSTVEGVNVLEPVKVEAFGTGLGDLGTYTVYPPVTAAAGLLYAGRQQSVAPTEFTVQLDIHGPDSAENAQIISTLIRDEYGCSKFEELNAGVQPLYTSDPMQAPFTNAEQQYEDRWTVDVVMQANPVVSVPLQFADFVNVTLIQVP